MKNNSIDLDKKSIDDDLTESIRLLTKVFTDCSDVAKDFASSIKKLFTKKISRGKSI